MILMLTIYHCMRDSGLQILLFSSVYNPLSRMSHIDLCGDEIIISCRKAGPKGLYTVLGRPIDLNHWNEQLWKRIG
jgi:hypothetical protein